MKYIKKPIAIEAITFEELVDHGIAEYKRKGMKLARSLPWSFDYNNGSVTHENDDCYLIGTLEGTMRFNRGDMLITGVQGEIYPCKKDIFEATYSPVRMVEPLQDATYEADMIAAERATIRPTFHEELNSLINSHSMENGSNTPDWILADYLIGCMRAYEMAIHYRERFHGRPSTIGVPAEAPVKTMEEEYREAMEKLGQVKVSSLVIKINNMP